MVNFNERENIKELINTLFTSIDNKNWNRAIECFTEDVYLDLSSLGIGKAGNMGCDEIVTLLEKHFAPYDKMHHQTGDFRITPKINVKEVSCYIVIYCYKENAEKSNRVKKYIGSFEFLTSKKASIDKVSSMKYHHKFIDGNEDL